jgi:hypothetical protein
MRRWPEATLIVTRQGMSTGSSRAIGQKSDRGFHRRVSFNLEMVDTLGTSKATGTCEKLLEILRMRRGKAVGTEDMGCGHARSR